MMLQIVETRLLSVIAQYHLAFFSISMAMFGMTAGAVWVYYEGPALLSSDFSCQLSRLSTAFALSIAVAIAILVTQVPVLVLSFTAVLVWGQISIILAMPFFFAGSIVSLALTRSPFPVGRVYASDLVGASIGCLAVLGLLDLVDAPSFLRTPQRAYWLAPEAPPLMPPAAAPPLAAAGALVPLLLLIPVVPPLSPRLQPAAPAASTAMAATATIFLSRTSRNQTGNTMCCVAIR